MDVFSHLDEMTAWSEGRRADGQRIGFVPTMGALHDGHLSLVAASVNACDRTVVSIFVNPTQFGPGEDFEAYPREIEKDMEKLKAAGCDVVFTPAQNVFYPDGFSTWVIPDEDGPAGELEGAHRPGHFRGVTTIVTKLFGITRPHVGFFGAKDYQQSVVLRQMVQDLHIPVDVTVCQTVREVDGLAMSSRNTYLSTEERQDALCLHRALTRVKEMVECGERDVRLLIEAMEKIIGEVKTARPDYVAIRDADSLATIAKLERPAQALLAVHIGTTRLIDNIALTP